MFEAPVRKTECGRIFAPIFSFLEALPFTYSTPSSRTGQPSSLGDVLTVPVFPFAFTSGMKAIGNLGHPNVARQVKAAAESFQ